SYDGEYFRIATTVDNVTKDGEVVSFSVEDRTNSLYILNNQMQIAGKVEGLAKGESIKSARFIGNMAYVVTFRQTDPLFVIDLSDPENPTVKGELKIPGFSEYLHPITENLIVGVGQDGTETGTNGDCKVSLFDVSNPYEPKETVSLPVSGGSGYVWTGVSFNHKLYVTLSNTEFAVPFYLDWYVNSGDIQKGGTFYIRYKLENGTLCEVNRYDLDVANGDVLGGTYVEDTFYVVAYNNDKRGMEIIAFDLTTNEEISRIKTYEK
ncbi:MAG: beta-propeller domain-containing protein, partial [Clostridia bacterium]|nr:beta-propeller domain-containing protein [Clostridia bacterium]